MEIEKRIRVRMLKRHQNREAGKLYNLPAPEARQLLEAGKAVVVDGPSETKPFGPSETKPFAPGATKTSKKKPRISADSES